MAAGGRRGGGGGRRHKDQARVRGRPCQRGRPQPPGRIARTMRGRRNLRDKKKWLKHGADRDGRRELRRARAMAGHAEPSRCRQAQGQAPSPPAARLAPTRPKEQEAKKKKNFPSQNICGCCGGPGRAGMVRARPLARQRPAMARPRAACVPPPSPLRRPLPPRPPPFYRPAHAMSSARAPLAPALLGPG